MGEENKKISIFYSYAHKNIEIVKKLIDHMGKEYIVWYDGMIAPGGDWNKEIQAHLDDADIILLLISDAFMGSKFCYDKEMPRALERWQAGEATVIPIILVPTVWEYTQFGVLQALPTGAKPISEWANPDEACRDIVVAVRRIIHEKLRTHYILVAEEYSENEEYVHAIKAYKSALRLFPTDQSLHKACGDVYYKSNDLNMSLEAYNKAIACGPKDVQLYLRKGNVLYEQGQLQEALSTYEEALSCDRTNALLYEKKGDVLFILNTLNDTLEEALEMYNQALVLNQSKVKRTELLKKIAGVYANLVEVNSVKMLDTYQEAMQNSSADVAEKVLLLRDKGNKLVALGQLEKALEAFDEALQIDAENAYSHKERGDVLSRMNRLPEAFMAYNEAIHLKPDFELAKQDRQQVWKAMEVQRAELAACLEREEQAVREDESQQVSQKGL